MLENLTMGHLIYAGISFVILLVILIFGIPFYSYHLETRDMRNEVRWADTWNKVALTLPPGTDLNEYILYRKIEDTDIEVLK